jgi:ABC-type multidrug transport system fused ATPase/permease subunit
MQLYEALDTNQCAVFSEYVAAQWLSLRLQALGAVVVVCVATVTVLSVFFDFISLSPGLAGLALSYSLSIVSNLNGFLGALTETEKEMISVERVDEFCHLPQEREYETYDLQEKAPDVRTFPRLFTI